MQKKVYILEGLDCANCAAKIETKLKTLPELQDVSITFATKQLRFSAENPAEILPEIIEIIHTVEPEVEVKERKHHHHEHVDHDHEEDCCCGHEHNHHDHEDDCCCGHEHHHHDHGKKVESKEEEKVLFWKKPLFSIGLGTLLFQNVTNLFDCVSGSRRQSSSDSGEKHP